VSIEVDPAGLIVAGSPGGRESRVIRTLAKTNAAAKEKEGRYFPVTS